MLSSIDCDSTYANEQAVKDFDDSQSSKSAPDSVASILSNNPSAEASSNHPFSTTTIKLEITNSCDHLEASRDKWRLATFILIGCFILLAFAYIIYSCLRFKSQRDELRKQLSSNKAKISKSNSYVEEPLVNDK